jgi:uncharacterized protein YecE (DUF72 family)
VNEQLDLFGSTEAAPPDTRVEPAAVDAATARLGERLPQGIYLGTSSWSFPTWQGLVYRHAADAALLARCGLAAYGSHPVFRSVGVDRTYYGPIAEAAYADYADQVPAGFRFLVKAPRDSTTPCLPVRGPAPATDNPRFLDPDFAVEQFVVPCTQGLGEKAGPLVFQFPPLGTALTRAPARFAARLRDFLTALPEGPIYAIELRDPELLCGELVTALTASGARLCIGVHPRMPTAAEQGALLARLPKGPLVVRWNLHSGFTYEQARSRYFPFDRLVDEDPATRAALVALCQRTLADGEPAFVIANNKAEGSAPLTIIKLAEALVGQE